uniref:Uncharacterized protein n=1 Tax=Acrobeloides nanus TaxID=290746 RepID=A0A914EF54_9BILA
FKKAYEYAFINQAFITSMGVLMLSTGEGMSEKENSIQEARNEKYFLRVKFALEDAVKMLEKNQPDWLVEGA